MPSRKCGKSKHYKLLCTNSIVLRRAHVMSNKLISIKRHLDNSNHHCVVPTKDLSSYHRSPCFKSMEKKISWNIYMLTIVGLFSHLYIIRFSMKLERKRMKTIINPDSQSLDLICNSGWIVPQKSHLSK